MYSDPRSHTVDGLLRRTASRSPDGEAIEFEGQVWTYQEFDRAVDVVTSRLHRLGLNRGDRVAAFGGNSAFYVMLYLACSRAGVVHVPINNALTGRELEYLITDSGAAAIVADPDLTPLVRSVIADRALQVLEFSDRENGILDTEELQRGSAPQWQSPASPGDLVQLLYTSGTTSRPKGAMMSHQALISEYISTITALDFTEQDRPLVCMPLYHSAGMHIFTVPYLMLGTTIRLLRKPDIELILRRIEEDQITSLFLAPTVWVPLSQHPDLSRRDLGALRKAQYGASIMPTPVLAKLRRALPNAGFYNCFGQSEIGPLASVLRPEEHDARPASCGRSVLFVTTRVVDDSGNDVQPGEPGEVLYQSPQLCLGYWNNPEATERAFRDGWFHSGDLVTKDADGYITVVDRLSDVINSGGVMIAPREVEEALYEHPAVAEVAVVGIPDDRWIEAVTAFVVVRDDQQVSDTELTGHAKTLLAPFKVPKSIHFVNALPRNQSGKLLKRELRDPVSPTT
ncbi:fatty acyl-CoA synthetase [Dietzia cinnamea]|jgi:fatty-acyl-CoA synthase|uniref:fatty acyl-CoA synthetase n=1 Tax=Dietzia TaxID=37914 RepID=UPI0007829A7C|nr:MULTISPECIES: fatty acyl-CoA synthetase [Dietzia]AVM66240.1 acyl-CoA synthetase [Dietzia sp. oral taxon 368]MCT1886881.1 fatty acyl-CoA synthetase [Dietzia cinnamea]MCT2299572.1 fatty acyl-CoA synthetase [Dietzia cinnamea]